MTLHHGTCIQTRSLRPRGNAIGPGGSTVKAAKPSIRVSYNERKSSGACSSEGQSDRLLSGRSPVRLRARAPSHAGSREGGSDIS